MDKKSFWLILIIIASITLWVVVAMQPVKELVEPIETAYTTDIDLEWSSIVTFGEVTIYSTGEVDYPDDISQASKDFWEAVMDMFPDFAYKED